MACQGWQWVLLFSSHNAPHIFRELSITLEGKYTFRLIFIYLSFFILNFKPLFVPIEVNACGGGGGVHYFGFKHSTPGPYSIPKRLIYV